MIMKQASEKQISFAKEISHTLKITLPSEESSYAYYCFINNNIERYREAKKKTFRRRLERECEEHKTRTYTNENPYGVDDVWGVDIFDMGIYPWGNS